MDCIRLQEGGVGCPLLHTYPLKNTHPSQEIEHIDCSCVLPQPFPTMLNLSSWRNLNMGKLSKMRWFTCSVKRYSLSSLFGTLVYHFVLCRAGWPYLPHRQQVCSRKKIIQLSEEYPHPNEACFSLISERRFCKYFLNWREAFSSCNGNWSLMRLREKKYNKSQESCDFDSL